MAKEAARRHRARVLQLFCLLTLVSILAPGRAHAYVDPSTGSILLQVLVAGALGAAFTVKQWWQRVATAARQLRARVTRR
jgi:uncharacterized membrane protein YoaK (UPF0700 family)